MACVYMYASRVWRGVMAWVVEGVMWLQQCSAVLGAERMGWALAGCSLAHYHSTKRMSRKRCGAYSSL